MKSEIKQISDTRLKRLRQQGFTNYTDRQLEQMAFGIRFPYRLCVAVIVTAIVTGSIPLFAIMLGIAVSGIFLPNHPFDYIYNGVLSKWMRRPKLPPRANQLKFACTIASVFLAATVYLMVTGATTAGLILAGILAGVAVLPSTIDLCVPSIIYNALFGRKAGRSSTETVNI
ncbi:MAG: DUF4395 domain-containing protein [Balneolaceae bacterium]|nr:DUF4395 domain-containing protein [Balneolaceae bacterium]